MFCMQVILSVGCLFRSKIPIMKDNSESITVIREIQKGMRKAEIMHG